MNREQSERSKIGLPSVKQTEHLEREATRVALRRDIVSWKEFRQGCNIIERVDGGPDPLLELLKRCFKEVAGVAGSLECSSFGFSVAMTLKTRDVETGCDYVDTNLEYEFACRLNLGMQVRVLSGTYSYYSHRTCDHDYNRSKTELKVLHDEMQARVGIKRAQ